MEIAERLIVVTGGASGIGRAMCEAFGERGARLVVVADIDGAGAQTVADGIVNRGGRAIAARTDVAVESDLIALARQAEVHGPIDLFCSNAGIFERGGVELGSEQWQRMWDVNVMSHVYATRAVVPAMVERGEGYLLHTASAAGLLTQFDSASYAVTKHAVVALAEWLSITYGDAGIKVSCLCPQGVRTNMLGFHPDGPATAVSPVTRDGIMEASEVADAVIAGLAAESFLILPHPVVGEYERRRANDRERWLGGMRRARAALGDTS
ncbi:MAG: short-chain dehydrogenase [Acidimicrobiia bacterium]|nr:short-chain dehydrogenase [Acidimicrobiia bacterium]